VLLLYNLITLYSYLLLRNRIPSADRKECTKTAKNAISKEERGK